MKTLLVPSKSVVSKGVPTHEASAIFSVSVAMHTRAVKHYKGTFQSSPLLYAGKIDLVLCVPGLAVIMSSCERHASIRIVFCIAGTKPDFTE